MKILGYILIAIPLIYFGILLGFYFIQDYLIFRGEVLHKEYEFLFKGNYKEKMYKNEGVELNTILFKGNGNNGVVFYNHGNAGNLQYWGQRAEIFNLLGYDVFMYDYRTFGKSTGKLNRENLLHQDAKFLYEELKKKYKEEQIVIYGVSLGSGIAAKLAMKKDCKSLLLETPYYNFSDVINFHYPYLPVRVISKYKFKTNQFIKKVKCPIFILHGTNDETVPFISSERLIKKNKGITLYTVPNGGHSNLPDFEEYREGIEKALNF